MLDPALIRNFSIIAHVDHGKSTLADRFLELTNSVTASKMKEQFLDRLSLERERGITIKAQAVSLKYKGFILNLIDTPGHVDFAYEVSRSLAACEGALLLVDATQGVEAQTLANAYLAIEAGCHILPVVNKIDLPNSDIGRTLEEIREIVGISVEKSFAVSGKTGQGVDALLSGIIELIPPPSGSVEKPLKALVIDSWYDSFKGAVLQIRVFDGVLSKGDRIAFLHADRVEVVNYVGLFDPFPREISSLSAGMVGQIACNLKSVRDVKIGDTIVEYQYRHKTEPIKGFREVKPKVFGGFYPDDQDDFDDLKEALEKLSLNDSAITLQAESSAALGRGFRCGFLGLLHMEITKERLEREFGVSPVVTTPSVPHEVLLKNGSVIEIENPSALPDLGQLVEIREPFVSVTIHTPAEYVGSILELCQEKRGRQISFSNVAANKIILQYQLPLAEIVTDFHDKLKALSKGYASFDYEPVGFRPSDVVRIDVKINNEPVDALSFLVHRSKSYYFARNLVDTLKEHIERQLFEVNIQACTGSRVIASAKLAPLRKNVTAKCYGGDITRKRKLLEKQKEGKKRLKQLGSVEVDKKVFLQILKKT